MNPRPEAAAIAALLLTLGGACAPSSHIHPRGGEEVARGYAHLGRGDLERAEVAFEHALEFNPDYPEALNGLGIVARRRERLDAARRHFEQAVHLAPDFAEGHSNLGAVLLAQGHATEAEEAFRAALRIDPDLLDARLDLARTLLHRGRVESARRADLWLLSRREYLHLLESHPDLWEAHHDLAFLAYEQGAYADAERGYREAVRLDPGSIEALHGLCISLVRLGRCDEGAAECRRCLERAPGQVQCETSLRGALACAGPK